MPELLLEKSDYKTARYCIFAGISITDKGVSISVTPLKKANKTEKDDFLKKYARKNSKHMIWGPKSPFLRILLLRNSQKTLLVGEEIPKPL